MPSDSQLENTANIVFSPDALGYHTLPSSTRNTNGSLLNDVLQNQSPKLSSTGRQSSSRHVRFQESSEPRKDAVIHPLFRKRPLSAKAGDVTPLDHWITRHGGTTSSFEELPHRIKSSKTHNPLSLEERVEELTREKGFLLQEMMYQKETRAAEMRFLEKVTELRSDLEAAHAAFNHALDVRARERMQAESDFCNYWGIDFGDGNIEDAIF